jgi:acetyl-CoA acetyltransferase
MIHVRHAAAAIASGLCDTVLLRGRPHPQCRRADDPRRALRAVLWADEADRLCPRIPVLRYMKTYGLSHEQLAMVSVVQCEWAKNPRASFKAPITVEGVLNSRMIAYPFRVLQCRLV